MKAKKIVALLLASVMTLSLMACGGGSTPEATDPAVTDDVDEADDEEDVDAEDDVDDVADTEEDADDFEELLAEVIPEETVTLDVFDQLANYSGEQIGWFGQIMLEKFNVKLNIIPDPDGAGVYETRMESGNLGDIVIWGADGDEYLQAVEKGMLYDWNEDDLLSD